MARLQNTDAPMPDETMPDKPRGRDRMKNMVEVYIPRIPGEPPNMFVALNGVRYLIGRGKTSLLPEPVAKRALESEEARNKALDFIESLGKTNNTELARM